MLAKLEELEARYEQLSRELADVAVIADQTTYQQKARAHAELDEVVSTYRRYKRVRQEIEETRLLLEEDGDAELRQLAAAELAKLEAEVEDLERRLRVLLLPRDPNDDKSVIMEIRAGTGGEEAALFAAELYRMYNRYAEANGWRVELVDAHPTELGGFKEVVFSIDGLGAFHKLKFESGVHRVQRIPATEAGGRIHTSAATVAVLPEAEEVDVDIDPEDLRIDVFCSSGPGGQSVNTTQSAVRITHLPTGLVVSCQDEKSQHKNKDKALRVLRARLLALAEEKRHNEVAQARRMQVGTGDRSERIRTYNFPQGRVTDHRIGLTLHRLERILEGELDEIIEALITTEQAARLKSSGQ